MIYPKRKLVWRPAYRVIPTRFPAVGLFERVADADDFDALYALEAMTNDRLRDEVGDINFVPPEERLYGPGTSPIMAAFTHINPRGSRFSDGSYGVFYCAKTAPTSIAETRYHSARFMAATHEPPMRLQMRLYRVDVSGSVTDLRAAARTQPDLVDPDNYSAAQAVGRTLRNEGASGIVYPSVRHAGGECVAAFRTSLLKHCLHAAYLEYNWNGSVIDAAFEVSPIL